MSEAKTRKPNTTCVLCGAPYYARPHKKTTHLYCSAVCYKNAHHITRSCLKCGKIFTTKSSDPKQYCTIQCANLDLKSKDTTTKICPVCDQPFKTYKPKRIYCSRNCFAILRDQSETKECVYCGNPFAHSPSLAGKFCSKECSQKYQDKKVKLICQVCNEEFFVSPAYVEAGRKYCSKTCYDIARPPHGTFADKLQRGHRTSIEAIMEQVLQNLGIEYKWEKKLGKYWLDFFLPTYNIGIECDEPYWHDSERDARKDAYILSRYQVKVVRFTTQQIMGDITTLLADALK